MSIILQERNAQIEKNALDIQNLLPGGEYGQNTSWILLDGENGFEVFNGNQIKKSLIADDTVDISIDKIRAKTGRSLKLFSQSINKGILFTDSDNIKIGDLTDPSKALFFDNVNGRVGFGTEVPQQFFHVQNNNTSSPNILGFFRNENTDSGERNASVGIAQANINGPDDILGFAIHNTDGNDETAYINAFKIDMSSFIKLKFQAKSYLFKTNGTYSLEIKSNGMIKTLVSGYEGIISDDNDIPNKKYVDDLTASLTTDDIAEGTVNKYYSDELAQDAVGNILTDTDSIDFTYDDSGDSISAVVNEIDGGGA